MKEKDLLLLLQDFVEETGMFNHIKIHYTKHRPYKISVIKNIIIKGINLGLLEIFKNNESNKEKYQILNKVDSISAVNDDINWTRNIYEVVFIDTQKYLWILFGNEVGNKQTIPKEFREFIVD